MTTLRRSTLAQRLVLVVGLGLLMIHICVWWYAPELGGPGDWFAYSSMTDVYFVVRRRDLEHLLVPAVLITVWTAVSFWVLGLGAARDDD